MKLKLSFRKIASAVALATLAAPSISAAQDTFIEEIVVTATKRAQTLQDIPIAVTVTSADTVEKAQIQDLLDIQSVVPSLRVSQLQLARNTSFSIRGFGNGANNIGIEPSVGVFVDGVYRSRSGATITDLPRLERVEVLSGPQNTLFGKNASAGVVSVVTPKPSGESGGFISGSFGNFNAVVLKGLYEGAINEGLTYDIAGTYNSRDGYFENLTLGDELNGRDRYSVRGQLNWTPSDRLNIRILADYDDLDEDCCGVVNLVAGPTAPIISALGGNLVANNPGSLVGFTDDPSTNQIENSGVSIQTDYEFDGFTATSIVAFRNSSSLDNQDVDFTSADLTDGLINDIEIDTFTSEFRLASSGDGAVDWLVGGFYFDESIEQDSELRFGTAFRPFVDIARGALVAPAIQAGLLPAAAGTLSGVEAILGLPNGSFFQNNSGVADTSKLDNQSISLFANVDWRITDELTATVGVNYTDDEKDFSIDSITTEVRANIPVAGPAAALIATVPSFAQNTINIPNPVEDGRTNDDDVTYTLRLAYDVNDSVNVYGSYGTGFKASSIDLLRDSAPNAADFAALQALGLADPNAVIGSRFAAPEEAEVFELGLKARFDNGLVNVAIFDQTLENFQSAVFNGTSFFLGNAEQQSVVGAEFDFKYQVSDALGFGINATYLDAKFDSFTQASPRPQIGLTPGSDDLQDLSGRRPAGIPELALSLSAQYDFTLGGFDSYIRGDYQFEDEVQVVDNIPASVASREVSQLNLALGFETQNGLNVTLWGRNVTDDEYLISVFPAVAQAGSISGFRNQPRTYGVTIRKDF